MRGLGSSHLASAPDKIGISPEGLSVNDNLVIRRVGPLYVPLFADKYRDDQDLETLHKISKFLSDGDIYTAAMYASTTRWSGSKLFRQIFEKANFNPLEARDYRGRWTRDNAGFASSEARIAEIGYNGVLHDAVVDSLIDAFRKVGATAEKNITVLGVPGLASIPDLIVLRVGAKKPIVIEVKTGQNPPFTPNQEYVYPLICIGGHVSSSDFRLPSLGLSDGATFPPLDVFVLSTSGPGKPLYPLDLCKFLGLRP